MQELDNGSNGAVSTIYLSGNPGCGKTQLARQIGEQFFKIGSGTKKRRPNIVATLNAETFEALADSCINLAKKLGITEYSLTNLATTEVNSPKERIQHLQCLIFPKFKQFSKWLIIADNVVDLSSVCTYLKPHVKSGVAVRYSLQLKIPVEFLQMLPIPTTSHSVQGCSPGKQQRY